MGYKALLDIDGVVLDVLSHVKEYIPSFNPEGLETYNFGGNIGCDKREVYRLLKDPEFMRGLKPYIGAVDAVKKLAKYIDIHAWTHVAPAVVDVRGSQIGELGINGYIYTDEDKDFLPDYDFLFEDKLEPCIQYASAGKTVFLIDHTYNRGTEKENIIRCADLVEAVDICLRLVNEKSI